MKKVLLVLIILLQLFIFVGCKKDIDELTIGDQYIFTMEEEHYYVYFYKDGCSSCELTTPTVLEYAQRGDIKVYAVNLHPEGEDQSRIFRKFTLGNSNQGENGDFYVNGVSSWSMLYIASSPALIEVKTVQKDETTEKKAYFVASGKEAINQYFNELLND